ncbi:CotY/CotZ family spore coat protein [Thalassobacillus sp. CUG 92003]|uniref:CotY/CotZ family spore coat protein n=1 Tax=Thalassobacillus sp. CUG 92003 TaxID=2736641 RepID=UPI0015E6EFBE|nr:CotY/CotZ family spore coat protein [Thalassobacillus sp. CUG 92003]
MSCEKEKDFNTCVCETVAKIIRAQDEVAGVGGCCSTGCVQSIRDLISPMENGNDFTAIPFALYCKGDCEPFIGSGIFRSPVGGSGMTALRCVETPIFQAKKFVDKEECCVQLELLLPVTMGGSTPGPSGKGNRICDFFPGNSIRNLQATGICITVDLDCFCGIVCLDPVSPLPLSEFNMSDEED